MLASRSTSSIAATSTFDSGVEDDSNELKQSDSELKKRGRCFSKLFQVSSKESSSSKFRKHTKKTMTTRSESSTPLGSPTSSSTTLEPSSKRILREVVTSESTSSKNPGILVVQSSVEMPSSQADCWRESLDKLVFSSPRQADDTWKQALPLANSIADAWMRFGLGSSTPSAQNSFDDWNKKDLLSCPKCGGVLHQAVTLRCGHSFCRKCSSALDHCSKCPRDGGVQPELLKTNVTVSTLVEKWWSNEIKAIGLRNEGNVAFADQQYDQALEKYHRAIQLGIYYVTIHFIVFTFLSSNENEIVAAR